MKQHWLKQMRRAGVPLVMVETSDAAQTIRNSLTALNGKADELNLVRWDCGSGLSGLNALGNQAAQTISDGTIVDNLADLCNLLRKNTPERTIIFVLNPQISFEDKRTAQGIWNLRDIYKTPQVNSTFVMLVPSVYVPELLKNDVVTVIEPLPNLEELRQIVETTLEAAPGAAEIKSETREKAARSILGLNAWAGEQSISLALSETGLSVESVLEQRRSYIAQTDGLEIRLDKTSFADVAGYNPVKERILAELKGKFPPDVVLWLDEIREAFAGLRSLDGTSADQVAHLQTWIQDLLNQGRFMGMFFVGFPGTSKSMISASIRNEAKCECVRFDLGAVKGSLVGESEAKIRRVTKTLDAITGGSGNILCVATCNGLEGVPSPFVSRFTGGTYFFDLPTPEENAQLWKIKRAKFNIPETDLEPESTGWTGREIHQCCSTAERLGISLGQAARMITPFCKTGRNEIETLRQQAAGKWLSASVPGLYVMPSVATGRAIGKG